MISELSYRRLDCFLVSVIVMSCVLLGGTNAWGQDGFDLQQFQPMPDQSRNFLSSSSAMVPPHLEWQSFLLFNYANAPLVLENDQGVRSPVVASQSTVHLMGSVGLYDIAEFGIDLPLVVQQSSGDVALDGLDLGGAGFGTGDLRLVPKIQVFSTREVEDGDGMALAVISDIYLPLGDSRHLQGGEFRGGIRLAYDMVIAKGTRLAVNAGYLMRPTREVGGLEVGDALSWAVAAELPVLALDAPSDLRIIGELAGKVGLGAEEMTTAQVPMELLMAARYQYDTMFAQLGAGVGLVSGYGTPRMRALFSLGFVADSWHSATPLEETPMEQMPGLHTSSEVDELPVDEDAESEEESELAQEADEDEDVEAEQ